jgi:hypothetical protein
MTGRALALRGSAIVVAMLLGAVALPGTGCGGDTLLGTMGDDGGSEADDAVAEDVSPVERIPDIGAPGWRDSTEPWRRPPEAACDWRTEEHIVIDVFPDETGVYVLFDWGTFGAATFDGGPTTLLTFSVTVNRGAGWEPFFSGQSPCSDPTHGPSGNPALLAGSVAGELIATGGAEGRGYDPDEETPPRRMNMYSDGALLRVGPDHVDNWEMCSTQVLDAFIVHDGLGYATGLGDGSGGNLHLRIEGTRWTEFSVPPLDLYLTWADEDDLYLAGSGGLMLSQEADGWLIHDVGTTDDFVSLWGFDGDDVWAGTITGALWHYDGAAWTEVPWPNPRDPANPCDDRPHAPLGMWGVDGELFFHTRDAIVHWDGEFEVLGHWPRSNRAGCPYDGVWIWRVRGLSPVEVFVAGQAETDPGSGCRQPFILYWDGSAFHWM